MVKRPQQRWLEFSLAGLMGAAVQLGTLFALTEWGDVPPLVATSLAIELALVHNFLWHEQLTWRDRPSSGREERMRRLLAFHLANGGISLAGNLAVTAALLHYARLPPVAANFTAICLCATVNFLVGDRWVFQQ